MASLLTMFCFVAFAQKTVTGTVKDANGEPMIGVTIATGTGTGAVTDGTLGAITVAGQSGILTRVLLTQSGHKGTTNI